MLEDNWWRVVYGVPIILEIFVKCAVPLSPSVFTLWLSYEILSVRIAFSSYHTWHYWLCGVLVQRAMCV